jgi:hypothetical protein
MIDRWPPKAVELRAQAPERGSARPGGSFEPAQLVPPALQRRIIGFASWYLGIPDKIPPLFTARPFALNPFRYL